MTANERIRDLLMSPETPILEAIEILNAGHKRIALVVDGDLTLLGVVTDSNFRRAILEHLDLSQPVSEIMRRKPVTATPNTTDVELLELMETTTHYQIPVVDGDGRVLDIRFLNDVLNAERQNDVRDAIIMVGGLGTRLYPMTKDTPKPLLPVGGRPLLFTIIDQLLAAGIFRIHLTVNYRSEVVTERVQNEPRYRDHVRFIEESKRLGTAGALSLLKDRPTGPFVVMNGDLLTKVAIDEMVRFHRHERNVMTVALRREKFPIPYGVAEVQGTRILRLVEKPEHTHFINTGVYVMEPYVLDRVPSDTYYDMTTLIGDLLANDLRVGSFPVYEYWLDIGTPSQLEKAREDYDNVFGLQSKEV